MKPTSSKMAMPVIDVTGNVNYTATSSKLAVPVTFEATTAEVATTTNYAITNNFGFGFKLLDFNDTGAVQQNRTIVTGSNTAFTNVPLGPLYKKNNEFYDPNLVLANVDGHIELANTFYNVIDRLTFTGFFSLVKGQSWVEGMALRLIIAEPTATDNDIRRITSNLPSNVLVLAEEYYPPSNVRANFNLSNVAISQDVWSKIIENNEIIKRNNYKIYFQLLTDNNGTVVQFDNSLTNISSNFVTKKFYNIETGTVVPMLLS